MGNVASAAGNVRLDNLKLLLILIGCFNWWAWPSVLEALTSNSYEPEAKRVGSRLARIPPPLVMEPTVEVPALSVISCEVPLPAAVGCKTTDQTRFESPV